MLSWAIKFLIVRVVARDWKWIIVGCSTHLFEDYFSHPTANMASLFKTHGHMEGFEKGKDWLVKWLRGFLCSHNPWNNNLCAIIEYSHA